MFSAFEKNQCSSCSADELLLTEMLFAGSFNDLEPPAVVALLSTFVAESSKSSGDPPKINERLSGILRQCQEFARKIATVTRECEVPIDETAYIQALKPDLMEICFDWCNGASFAEICRKTVIYEGEKLLKLFVMCSLFFWGFSHRLIL